MNKILLTSLLIILTSFACKKLAYDPDPNEVESNGVYITDTLYAITDSVVNRSEIFTGFSEKFALGQRDGLKAGFLVYFAFLDTVENVDSVSVQFTTLNSYGTGTVDQVSANIYSVDSLWGGAANQYNRYRNPPVGKMEFVTRASFKTADSSNNVFRIPLDYNNIWIGYNDSLADTVRFNFFFQPETGNENTIVELGSYLSDQNPILIYRKVSEDTTVIDTIDAVLGATIFNYDPVNGTAFNYPDETVISSSGIIKHSLFKFDYSHLPENAIYYRARLQLSEDDMNPYENSDNKKTFELGMVENYADTVYNPSSTLIMTSDEGLTEISGASSNTLAEDFIQPLINKDFGNQWLEVGFYIEDEDFSIKRFWGAKSPDPEKRPKLIIDYLNANK